MGTRLGLLLWKRRVDVSQLMRLERMGLCNFLLNSSWVVLRGGC